MEVPARKEKRLRGRCRVEYRSQFQLEEVTIRIQTNDSGVSWIDVANLFKAVPSPPENPPVAQKVFGKGVMRRPGTF